MDYDAHQLKKLVIFKEFSEKSSFEDEKPFGSVQRLFTEQRAVIEGLKHRNQGLGRMIQV